MKTWKKVEKIAKTKELLAHEIERTAQQLKEQMDQMLQLNLEQFVSAPETDCLLDVSPMGPQRLKHALKQHFAKLGAPWEPYHPQPSELESLSARIKAGNQWILKKQNELI